MGNAISNQLIVAQSYHQLINNIYCYKIIFNINITFFPRGKTTHKMQWSEDKRKTWFFIDENICSKIFYLK